MKVLVTRALEDAGPLAAAVAARGHLPLIEPLLAFEPIDDAALPGPPVQAVLVTSRQAIRALARRPEVLRRLRSLPVLAVGDATAASVIDAGFVDVRSAGGDAAALETRAKSDLKPDAGKLLHVGGEDLAADSAGRLRAAGYEVETVAVYRMRAANDLTAATQSAIAAGDVDAVLLLSPRTARTWVRCVAAAGLTSRVRRLRHLCLSAAVADQLGDLAPHAVLSAREPTLEALLELLGHERRASGHCSPMVAEGAPEPEVAPGFSPEPGRDRDALTEDPRSMTDKKTTGPKGPDRPGETPPPKRPYATIDLKATEVKPEAARPGAPSTGDKPAAQAAATAKPGEPAKADAKAAATAAGAASPAPAAGAAKPAGPAVATAGPKAEPGKPASAATAAAPANSGGGAGRFVSHALAGVLGGVLALFGAGQLIPGYGLLGPQAPITAQVPEEVATRLAALEASQKAKAVDGPTQEVGKRLEAAEAGAKRATELAGTVATLTQAQAKLAEEAKALKAAIDKQAPAAEVTGRIGKLEETLKSVAAVAESDPRGAGRVPEIARLAGRLADIEEAFATRLATLRKELQLEITTRMQPVAEAAEAAKSGTQRIDREAAALKSDAARLAQRSEELKLASDRAAQLLRTLQEEAAALRVALDAAKTDVDARFKGVARPQDIASALAPLTTKVAALESNVAGVVQSEGDRKSTAERIVLSLELTNLKRAMDRGRGYAAELAEVKRISGGKIDLKLLEQHQANGLPTLADLARDLRPLIGQMLDLAAEPANASVWDRLMTGAKSIVRVRRTTATADDTSAEGIIARMETALREGRLADVLAESKKLEPRVVAPAQGWLKKVEARHAVEGALVQIDASLKAVLGGSPSQAPAPAPAAPPPAPAQPKAPEAKQ